MRVLVAEDDVRLAGILDQSLSEAGWQVHVEHDGQAALDNALSAAASSGSGTASTNADEANAGAPFDVLLLDWMLPMLDGLTVCRRLRSFGVRTPVLMLTARGTTPDKVAGLDAGADDYLTKPFDLDELLARLRALQRRAQAETREKPLTVGNLILHPAGRRATRAGTTVDLSAREFDILRLLMERAGKVV